MENGVFTECDGFTGELIIPDNVTTIGTSAFANCKGFTGNIIIPEKVNLIGVSAFWGTNNIESYIFKGNAPTIKNNAFNPNSYIRYKKNATGFDNDEFNSLIVREYHEFIQDLNINSIASQVYSGNEITPETEITNKDYKLVKDKDYTLSYKNNVKAGNATVIIKGIGDYIGERTIYFKILRNINSANVTGVVNKTYTGSNQSQKITVKYGNTTLKLGTDYTVSYKNNMKAGTATLVITGKGNYGGTKEVAFKINRKSITGFTFSKVNNYVYSGKAITPNVTVKNGTKTLVKGTDYKLTYTKNVNVGTATVTVTGLGNYTGTKKITFKINTRKISTVAAEGIVAKIYTGKAIYQGYKLTFGGKTLVKGTDFTIKYTNNIKVGTATITFTGKGNYTGTLKKTFKIVRKSIVDLEYSKVGNRAYTGAAIKPGVVVKNGTITLRNGTDYTVTYKNNIKLGTAKVIITGKGNYAGTKEIEFNIVQRDISGATVTGLKNRLYTGKGLGQSLTVTYNKKTLVKGIDYTLTYENNIEVGTANVTVTGIGNFKGTKTLNFKIVKK